MLDIKFIRTYKDIIKEAARKKGLSVDIDKLLVVDKKKTELEERQAKLEASRSSVNLKLREVLEEKEKNELSAAAKEIAAQIQNIEKQLRETVQVYCEMMLRVPNIPDISVPEGKDRSDNQPVKEWGEKRVFSFSPKNHIEIMEALEMVDVQNGSRVHGSQGYFLKNDGVLLCFAIWNYACNFFLHRGFNPFIVPAIVKSDNFYAAGYLPDFQESIYSAQNENYLINTSEVPLLGLHRNEILEKGSLPRKYLAFSPCFQKEASGAKNQEQGLFGAHEFFAWQQVVLCEASHAQSVHLHEEVRRNTEEFIESLEIPYRTMLNCSGDLGVSQVKKYSTQLWNPTQNKYQEISSASYFHDFQSRRFNTRYKEDSGESRFVHTLNCTAIQTPKSLVSLIENFQNEDGSITIPQVLVPYLGREKITKR